MTLAERIEKFNNLMGDIVPPEVKKDLLDKGFFTAPASTKYHGNYAELSLTSADWYVPRPL